MKLRLIALLLLAIPVARLRADQTIESVQQSLKDQGFYYGDVTGEKNADTTAAIRRFQIRNGLQITGELNDETLQAIKSGAPAASPPPSTASRSQPPAREPLSTPDSSDLRDDSTHEGGGSTSAPMQPYLPAPRGDRDLNAPSAGQVVPSRGGLFTATPYESAPLEVQRRVIADAQRILARRGLFKDEVDGAYGPALEFSLRAYQSKVGLPTTGRLDLETLAALQLLPGARMPVFTPRRPGAPPEPAVRGEWVRP